MDLFKRFATSPEHEVKGVWRELDDNCSLLIARWNNDKFNELFAVLQETHAEALATANAAEKERQFGEIIRQVMSQTILMGWRGPLLVNGTDLGEYSSTKAYELLEWRDFRDLIRGMATQQEHYLLHKLQETGND